MGKKAFKYRGQRIPMSIILKYLKSDSLAISKRKMGKDNKEAIPRSGNPLGPQI